MSGREREHSSNSRSVPTRRRKSLLHRITDTITSFLPSLFETKEEPESTSSDSDVEIVQHVAKRPRTAPSHETSPQFSTSSAPIRHSVTRITEFEIPAAAPATATNPAVVDVDLDAADDASDFSSASKASVTTSGVSSLLPRDHRPVVKPSLTDFRAQYMAQANTSNTVKRGPLELWTEYDMSRQNNFDVSTPSRAKRLRTESSSNVLNNYTSPFYRGRVSYGGAASVRSTPFAKSVFEQVEPLKFIMDTKEEKPNKAPPSSTVLQSATAQRILQNLEKHASVCPSKQRTAIPISNPFSPVIKPLQRTTTRYPPYMAAYQRYKELKRQSSASTPAPEKEKRDEQPTSTPGSSQKPSDTPVPSTSQSTIPSAPPRIRFDFSPSPRPKKQALEPVSTSSKSEVVAKSTPQASESSSKPLVCTETPTPPPKEPEVAKEAPGFVFSRPIALPGTSKPLVPSTGAKFTFSKPLPPLKQPAAQNEDSSSPAVAKSSDGEPPTKTLSFTAAKGWDCPTCLVKNKAELATCVCCQTSKVDLDSGDSGGGSSSASVFKFGAPKSNGSSETGLFKFGKPVSLLGNNLDSKWDCPTCLVKNDNSAEKCPCCSTAKPGGSATNHSPSQFGFIFGKAKWDCPTCLVKNDESVANCPCCKTAKPVGKSDSSSSQLPAIVFANSSNKWDCPTCLVKNDNSLASCPCCNTSKPGGTSSRPSFVFGAPKTSTEPKPLSFGASSADTWSCPTCLVKNKSDASSCPCCQTPKPGSADTLSSPPVIVSNVKPPTSFKFGEYTKTISSFAGSTCTPSFAFSATEEPSTSQSGFKLGFKPATFAPPIRPSPSSSGLKVNGGFQFSAPAPASLDFSAKKENLTPAATEGAVTPSNPPPPPQQPAVTFNFGAPSSSLSSSPSSSPFVFKFGASVADSNNSSASDGSSSGVNGRVMRRAVRRLNKN